MPTKQEKHRAWPILGKMIVSKWGREDESSIEAIKEMSVEREQLSVLCYIATLLERIAKKEKK